MKFFNMNRRSGKANLRKILWDSLKYLLAIGLIGYLLYSGKLSLADLQRFFANPLAAISSFLMVATVFALCFFRWQLLLRGLKMRLSYWNCVRLGMLGQFFSIVMPSTVGGDLIKGLYIAREYPQKKVYTLSTILLDRLMGLFGLVALGALAYLLEPIPLSALRDPKMILVWNWGFVLVILTSVILLGLIGFTIFGRILPERFPVWIDKWPGARFFHSLYDVLKCYRERPCFLWYSYGLSILSQGINILALLVVVSGMFGPPPWGTLDFEMFAVISSLGMVVMSLPLSPGGWGIAQFVFGEGMLLVGAPSVNFGTVGITGFQIVSLIANLMGLGFFLTYKKEQEKLGETLNV